MSLPKSLDGRTTPTPVTITDPLLDSLYCVAEGRLGLRGPIWVATATTGVASEDFRPHSTSGSGNMIKGAEANRAAENALANIRNTRRTHDGLDRIVFCFPKVKIVGAGEYKDGSALAVSAAAIARNPSTRVDRTVLIKHYGKEHSIPSCIVPLQGIADVEYHVSRQNMERLLKVGCIVFQKYKKGFGMRIPYDSPSYSGKPTEF